MLKGIPLSRSLAPGGPSDKNKGSLPRDGPLKRRSKTNMKMARLRAPVRLRGQRESSMAATISTVVGASRSRLAPRFADVSLLPKNVASVLWGCALSSERVDASGFARSRRPNSNMKSFIGSLSCLFAAQNLLINETRELVGSQHA